MAEGDLALLPQAVAWSESWCGNEAGLLGPWLCASSAQTRKSLWEASDLERLLPEPSQHAAWGPPQTLPSTPMLDACLIEALFIPTFPPLCIKPL